MAIKVNETKAFKVTMHNASAPLYISGVCIVLADDFSAAAAIAETYYSNRSDIPESGSWAGTTATVEMIAGSGVLAMPSLVKQV